MKKEKLKSLDIRYFLIPFFSLSLVFFFVTYFAVDSWIQEQHRQFEEDARAYADSYTESLLESREAYGIISGLLEEKLMVASQAIMMIEGNRSNSALTEIAEKFGLDEVHLYNQDGVIVFSKAGKYVGWRATAGHPVYDFMISDYDLLVEKEIRPDSESGIYYRYAYVRSSDGTFVQIGILAENIQRFLGTFELTAWVERIWENSEALQVTFQTLDHEVFASSRTDGSQQKAVQIQVPVFHDEEPLGTLTLLWPTEDLNQKVRSMTRYGIFLYLLVMLVTGSILYYAYRKNRANIRIAYYDQLTGLPNSNYLEEYLAAELTRVDGSRRAILLIQAMNFKTIQMTYGAGYSNCILTEFSQKLREAAGQGTVLFRYSSDKFGLVTGGYESKRQLARYVEGILESLRSRFDGNQQQFIDTKIGVMEIQKENGTPETILQDATLALSSIAGKQGESFRFYAGEMESEARRSDLIQKNLRDIIAEKGSPSENGFRLHFQPQIDCKSGRLLGFEALSRLEVQGIGPVAPAEFISIAETNFLIYDLGKVILKRACDFIGQLKKMGYGELTVAVNVSGLQLMRNEFAEDLMDILCSAETDTRSLELEITESILIENFDYINDKLNTLRKTGIGVSLDDFGTGFSSLSRLGNLSVDSIKLDRTFVMKIQGPEDPKMMSEDIISMAHKNGLRVVAEGVETEGQRAYLEKHQCDILQGYLFSKPLPEKDVLKFLQDFQ